MLHVNEPVRDVVILMVHYGPVGFLIRSLLDADVLAFDWLIIECRTRQDDVHTLRVDIALAIRSPIPRGSEV